MLHPADLAQPSWTPVGPGTYGRFMEIRVFDFWVHERDITTPLGRPTDDTGARAEIALAEVEGSLGYIVGKKVGLPDGRSIVFHLSGPLARDIAVVVDGRARVVDTISHARRGDLDGHTHLHAAGLRSHRPPGTHRSRYHPLARRRRARGAGGTQSQIHHVSPELILGGEVAVWPIREQRPLPRSAHGGYAHHSCPYSKVAGVARR